MFPTKAITYVRTFFLSALCFCVTLPLHLFCSCACPNSCCSASEIGLVSAASSNFSQDCESTSKPRSCCSHCKSSEPEQAVKLESSNQNRDRTEQPCHCLAQRALFGYQKSDSQASSHSYLNFVDGLANFAGELDSSRHQTFYYVPAILLSHNRRLALLGAWLN